MVLPLAGYAAVVIGGALINALSTYYSGQAANEAAQKASEAYASASAEKQAQIKALMDKIDSNWQTPEYEQTPLSPQEYVLLREFSPEIAQMTEEKQPQMVNEAKSQTEIGVQKQALQQFQQLATQPDSVAKMQTDLTTEQAKAGLESQRANILRQYAAKGLSGTGQELLAQISASDDQEKMARQEGLQAAIAQRSRQLDALRNMSTLAGQMRGENRAVESANVDAINQFNQRASMRKQTYDQYVAGMKNEAQLTNMKEAQRIADANVAEKNRMAILNRQRADQMAKDKADYANAKLSTQAGLAKEARDTQYTGTTEAASREAAGDIAQASGYGTAVAKVGQTAMDKGIDAYLKEKADADAVAAKKKEDEDKFGLTPAGGV